MYSSFVLCLTPVLVVLSAMLAHPAPAAAQMKPEVWRPRLEAWIAAVDAHVPGRLDASAATIGRWVNSDFAMMQPYVAGLLELLPPLPEEFRFPRGLTKEDISELTEIVNPLALRTDRNTFVKRAATAHADVMIHEIVRETRYVTEAEARLEARAGGSIIIIGKDGEPQGFGVAPRHWDFARWLLGNVRPLPAEDPFVRQWYRATTAFMFLDLRWSAAQDHLNAARRNIGPDAILEFDTGCLHETLASPSVTTVMQALSRTPPVRAGVAPPDENLELAEEAFREAVRLDPAFAEARIRLGRVLSQRGRHKEALELLTAGGADAEDPIVRYFAAMFLGDARQALGQPELAAEAYGTSAKLYPQAQSPHLALSVVAIENADRRGALDALQRVFELPRDERRTRDPWWIYHLGAGRGAWPLLRALWLTVPKARVP